RRDEAGHHRHGRCHTPRMRGIQYAAASRPITGVSGILDRPLQCAIAHKADDDTEFIDAPRSPP
ncbi:unnamed protein product, partial [Phaeothamnion confervicola]